MRQSTHALGRVAERLSPEDAAVVAERLARVEAHKYKNSVAVRLHRLPQPVGDPWGDGSNGSDVWAVIRGGTVATVMLRRKSQPTNPHAFGVERVIFKETEQ